VPAFQSQRIATLLLEQLMNTLNEAKDIVEMMATYAVASGRDWETFEQLLDHVARKDTNLLQHATSVTQPDIHRRVLAAITTADTTPTGGERTGLHQTIAMATLTTVWLTREHHLIDFTEWPDTLAEVVVTAVKQSARINNNPTMTTADT
jgi:hypothetical protein